jgi:hypothetical protein
LKNRRRNVLAPVFDVDFLSTASDEELILLVAANREADATGKLPSFGHVIARFAEQLLGRVV